MFRLALMEMTVSLAERVKEALTLLLHSFISPFFHQERVFLTISNYVFTTIFVAEMTVKVKHPFFLLFICLSPLSASLSTSFPPSFLLSSGGLPPDSSVKVPLETCSKT